MAIDDPFNQTLSEAVKRRILQEIEGQKQAQLVNNIYGGGGVGSGGLSGDSGHKASGLQELMASGDQSPDLFDYFVDIDREDKLDPEGNKLGWTKKVHRYRADKGSEPPKKKLRPR